jgi:SOS-response transcriptional repressor LexA
MRIYPNPSSGGIVYIDLQGNREKETYISIFNLSGKILYQDSIDYQDDKLSIPLEFLKEKGLFILRIENDGMIHNMKMEVL